MNKQRGSAAIGIAVVVGLIGLIIGIVMLLKLEHIPPGTTGVSVKKCGGGGVDPKPIPVGYYWRELFCENVIEYPTNLQTIVLTKASDEGDPGDSSITVTSSEGLPINVDVSLSFTLDAAKVPKLYEKFRQDVDHLKTTFVRQTIREALQASFAKYTAEQIYAEKRETVRAEAQEFLQEKLGAPPIAEKSAKTYGDYGFVIVQFTLNETRVPKQVVDAINAKVAMIQDAQRSEQEVRKKQAEAAQRVAQAKGEADAVETAAQGEAKSIMLRAEAQAKANEILSKSLTPALIEYQKAQKWNGALPQFTGGGAVPFINVGK